MRNISIGLVFKYNYNWEASIEEEFQQLREGVDNVNMPDLVYNSLNYVIPIDNEACDLSGRRYTEEHSGMRKSLSLHSAQMR